jgi:hypothetical protein
VVASAAINSIGPWVRTPLPLFKSLLWGAGAGLVSFPVSLVEIRSAELAPKNRPFGAAVLSLVVAIGAALAVLATLLYGTSMLDWLSPISGAEVVLQYWNDSWPHVGERLAGKASRLVPLGVVVWMRLSGWHLGPQVFLCVVAGALAHYGVNSMSEHPRAIVILATAGGLGGALVPLAWSFGDALDRKLAAT